MDKKAHHSTGSGKVKIDKIIMSPDLEREIAEICRGNKIKHYWSPEEIAVVEKYRNQVNCRGLVEILKKIFPHNAEHYTVPGVHNKIQRR